MAIQTPENINATASDYVPDAWTDQVQDHTLTEMLQPTGKLLVTATLTADDLDTRRMLFERDVANNKY